MRLHIKVSQSLREPRVTQTDTGYTFVLPVKTRWSESEQIFIGSFHKLGECCHADTEEELLEMLTDIAESWFLSCIKR